MLSPHWINPLTSSPSIVFYISLASLAAHTKFHKEFVFFMTKNDIFQLYMFQTSTSVKTLCAIHVLFHSNLRSRMVINSILLCHERKNCALPQRFPPPGDHHSWAESPENCAAASSMATLKCWTLSVYKEVAPCYKKKVILEKTSWHLST